MPFPGGVLDTLTEDYNFLDGENRRVEKHSQNTKSAQNTKSESRGQNSVFCYGYNFNSDLNEQSSCGPCLCPQSTEKYAERVLIFENTG